MKGYLHTVLTEENLHKVVRKLRIDKAHVLAESELWSADHFSSRNNSLTCSKLRQCLSK